MPTLSHISFNSILVDAPLDHGLAYCHLVCRFLHHVVVRLHCLVCLIMLGVNTRLVIEGVAKDVLMCPITSC